MTVASSKLRTPAAVISHNLPTTGFVGLGDVRLPHLPRCCEVGLNVIGTTKNLPSSCLRRYYAPMESFYLTRETNEFVVHTRLINASVQARPKMPKEVIGKRAHALNTQQKAAASSKILALGMTIKSNVDVSCAPQSADIMGLLTGLNAEGACSDAQLPSFPSMCNFDIISDRVKVTSETLQDSIL